MTTPTTTQPRAGLANLLAARARKSDERAARIADYRELTTEFRLSQEEAAARLGVSLRTVQRYEAALKAGTAA